MQHMLVGKRGRVFPRDIREMFECKPAINDAGVGVVIAALVLVLRCLILKKQHIKITLQPTGEENRKMSFLL